MSHSTESLILECQTIARVLHELHEKAIDSYVDTANTAPEIIPVGGAVFQPKAKKLEALLETLGATLNDMADVLTRLDEAQTRLFLELKHPAPAA